MSNKNFFNWDVKTGDYLRDEEYDKLYLSNKRHEKLIKTASWIGAAVVIAAIFFIVLETLTKV
ncbi:MAG: hypothetical protein LC102_02855 [Ignavibacteriales bacterium]|nr:MAG: hypothetical protein F9K26_06365 [Ignavibacteriaceae bacterium]MBW7873018.1 hypothetical protein [Ignavibacteria bacterium]MCZ2142353.1 hypothetical protein [Ignavibacteriales bacterium]OQY75874.1 MAG: hypothetical protein B6D45_04985 [Ignavibacteriales bacterium UTCHB3]WKZ73516.1 MAG: hypothetical protein QY308_04770 [Ignavibacteriaceae bacterium]